MNTALLIALIIIASAALVVALGFRPFSGEKEPARVTLRGSLKLTGGEFTPDGPTCLPRAGYDDINAGAAVVVHDPSGKVIATGALQSGRSSDFFENEGQQIAAACEFPFAVSNVPQTPFYGIQVSHRGKVTFTQEQAENGQITLTVGS